jgi:signal transduction histidine kinase
MANILIIIDTQFKTSPVIQCQDAFLNDTVTLLSQFELSKMKEFIQLLTTKTTLNFNHLNFHVSCIHSPTSLCISLCAEDPTIKQTLIELYKKDLTIMHKANVVFGQCNTLHELAKQAILLALNDLKIDRAGLLLLCDNGQKICGSWGTDQEGKLTDESDFISDLPQEPWVQKALNNHGYIKIWRDVPLKNYGKIIGTGWNAMVSIWNGDQVIGWLACDNLLGGADMSPELETLLQVFGSSIGQWYVLKGAEIRLQHINENLEKVVAEKTQTLQLTIDQLLSAKDKLISAERTKALAQFTAGIAHEINNPISYISSNLKFIDKASAKALTLLEEIGNTPAKVLAMLQEIEEVISESDDGLSRITDIIRMLQPLNKLASEQPQTFNLNDTLQFLLSGCSNSQSNFEVIYPDTDIVLNLPQQAFSLSLEQIIENAMDAVSEVEGGTIHIYTFQDEHTFSLNVADNGLGIPDDIVDQIFNPFFTTKPVGSGTGLGLSLAANLIKVAEGDIKLVSGHQTGTIVSLIFPIGVRSDV